MSFIRFLYKSFNIYIISFTKSKSIIIYPGVLYAFSLYPKFIKNKDILIPSKTILLNINYTRGNSFT
jgi:hypothetical protein